MVKISIVVKSNCHGGKKSISMLAQINFQGSKSDFHGSKNSFLLWSKSISKVVRINFHGGKNQFFPL